MGMPNIGQINVLDRNISKANRQSGHKTTNKWQVASEICSIDWWQVCNQSSDKGWNRHLAQISISTIKEKKVFSALKNLKYFLISQLLLQINIQIFCENQKA